MLDKRWIEHPEIEIVKKWLNVLAVVLLSGTVLSAAGCSGEAKARNGDKVKVDYTGKLSDGTVFDTSAGRQPLEFTIGEAEYVPGFEEAVVGMKVGESKTVTIPAAEAYGQRREDLVYEVDRSLLSGDFEPQVGQHLQTKNPDGTFTVVTIIKVDEKTITVDANPELAGKDLTFDITLVEFVPK